MAPFFALAEIAVAAVIIMVALKSFTSYRVATRWWLVLGTAAVLGGLAGSWLGFQFSYQPPPEVVNYSFPVPGGFHVLETYGDGTQRWVDFITEMPLVVAFANTCLVLSIPVALVWIGHGLVRRRRGGVRGV